VGSEQVLHELEKAHQIVTMPWINRIFFDVQIVHGWPFILSRYRDGSLKDLIANKSWSLQDRFASLIRIVRGRCRIKQVERSLERPAKLLTSPASIPLTSG
jgi:hypothetical protein